jgi:two-component system chemotaxis sensor kinase CheA
VPLTRLVHAGEDLLGIIRAGDAELTSEMVDQLLESLDHVSEWIEHLSGQGELPAGVVEESQKGVARLRALCPGGKKDGAEAGEAAADAKLDLEWLQSVPEDDLITAFSRAITGRPVTAIRYTPATGCFYNGEDPFNLFRQVPELLTLHTRRQEPWGNAEAFDPYVCNLTFHALSSASRSGEPQHGFRYVLEQTAFARMKPEDLICVQGSKTSGADMSKFRSAARHSIGRNDFKSLRAAAGLLLQDLPADIWEASALRWLAAVLDAPLPNPLWAAALAESAATRLPPDWAAATALLASLHAGASAGKTAVSPLLLHILREQERILALPAADEEQAHRRLVAVTAAAMNLARSSGRTDLLEVLAAVQAEEAGEAGQLAGILAGWRIAAEAAQSAAASAAPEAQSGGHPAEMAARKMLKVDQAKVDMLMNLIGELVVWKNSLPFLAKRAEEVFGVREMAREIKDQYTVIDRLSQEMQGSIMQVRMLPVSEVFERFPRLVRDLSRKLGKNIVLDVEGEDTAADKTIIECLGDPLIHIVRNSIDHGVETPEARQAAGKPEAAVIKLRAAQEADQIVIEVSDDGKGIDPQRIKAAAIAKGVIDAEQAERLSDQEAVNLIFHAGFSTAAEVSDLSGRGVGMDVVNSTVDKLGGQVNVTSQTGQGTTVRLSLPLSMAVTRVMMVEACGSLYGIPMDAVAETVRVPAGRITRIKQAETFVLRDTVVPLVRMSALLRLPETGGDDGGDKAVMVCRVSGTVFGVVVDCFREGTDVILKPLDGVLSGLRGFSGSALLGDGRVLLVLNLKELL